MTDQTLAMKYFDVVVKDMPTKFDMSARDLALWKCNKSDHAQDFVKAIPVEGLNQQVGPQQFGGVLRYRLGIPLFTQGSQCAFFNRYMDFYGDHALALCSEGRTQILHDLVCDTITDMCFRAGDPTRKEVDLSFLSNDGGALRPADILVHSWENGRMCVWMSLGFHLSRICIE
ncbi:uncharacterized protein LOC113355179 [Papaver somniferum]|uniref:uncharacterized protein LOC113355179 n=1 Tax=Papaver somniferum TaxID=3469 RepID=UPI000E6F5282|nr:uncharacterized protein LOC113355179 [Papaver somniferum]